MTRRLPRFDVPEEVADVLLDWLVAAGASHYEEEVTQAEHALQCAALAFEAGANESLVVAALLHDVGHLIVGEHASADAFLSRDRHHERIGARWLGRWFGEDVTEPVRLHVDAKRFLCAVDAGYARQLSLASRRSLALQGGPMSLVEAAAFEREAHGRAAVELRRFDDRAKVPGKRVAPASAYREMLASRMTS